MAYDQHLADRVRATLGEREGLIAKEMFGGVGYMLNGNMSCGVNGSDLIVRVGPDQYEQALSQTHVREFDMTGRPMRGWVVVEPAGIQTEDDLRSWIERGVEFASTLPPK